MGGLAYRRGGYYPPASHTLERNSKQERMFKEYLYSTATKTETWYLTQKSNSVKRYKGKAKLKKQATN